MRLTPLSIRIMIFVLLSGFLIMGYRIWAGHNPDLVSRLMPQAKTQASAVPQHAELPAIEGAAPAAISNASIQLPGEGAGCSDKPEVRFLGYAWNTQLGLLLANGGPQASNGSLMCKNGVNLKFARQDDNSKLQEALVTFASAVARGEDNPTGGAHFVAIMGDGSAAFLTPVNATLRSKLGPQYTAKIVGSCGYSRGEDKLMGKPDWRTNPLAARGAVIAGVIRDGDWNIAQKWAGDNGLKCNPDEKTYDPDALNFINTSDYIDAPNKYVSGYTEARPVVRNGKRTGETKQVGVDGVVTWTPGDVIVKEKKGGLVSIVSTREYTSQMPNVIIGIDTWMQKHPALVEGMLKAITDAGDMVKASPQALHKGAVISAAVYQEKDADANYWEKYFKGTVEKDAQGNEVELGGSSVNNLTDNLILFGLVPGAANAFAATYTAFGNIVSSQYPELLRNFPPADQVVDTRYLKALATHVSPEKTRQAVAAQKPRYDAAKKLQRVVSRRSWNIRFQTGRAAFTPQASSQLSQLLRDLIIAQGTVVEVHGHTDAAGNPAANQSLSEQRAFAVKSWLEHKNPVNFPSGRVRVFAHGQTQPIAPNATEAGRAQNRRVEVVVGTTGAG